MAINNVKERGNIVRPNELSQALRRIEDRATQAAVAKRKRGGKGALG